MKWFAAVVFGLCCSVAKADSVEPSVAQPQWAVGGGVGFAGLVHVDYQRWIDDRSFVEVGLTPLLLHNVVSVAFNQELPLASGSGQSEHGLTVGATWVHVVNMGIIVGGPGARLGYQFRRGGFGASVSGGAGVALGAENRGYVIPDARITLWQVKRSSQQ